jgi:hypothetical protein
MVPRGDVGVDKGTPLGSPIRLLTYLVPSVLEVVIELSDEDEPEDMTPPTGTAPATSIISTTPATSVTPAGPDIPGPPLLKPLARQT